MVCIVACGVAFIVGSFTFGFVGLLIVLLDVVFGCFVRDCLDIGLVGMVCLI